MQGLADAAGRPSATCMAAAGAPLSTAAAHRPPDGLGAKGWFGAIGERLAGEPVSESLDEAQAAEELDRAQPQPAPLRRRVPRPPDSKPPAGGCHPSLPPAGIVSRRRISPALSTSRRPLAAGANHLGQSEGHRQLPASVQFV